MDRRDAANVAVGIATKAVGAATMLKAVAIAVVLLLAGLLIFGSIMAASVSSASENCGPGGSGGGGDNGSDDPSDRTFNDEQIENAQEIDNAAKNGDLGGYAVKLGLMTALVESDLINIQHGDSAGPDSRGIFQQRDKAWGSESERMDPFKAAQAFFGVSDHATAPGLVDIDGWEDMEPTEAIHAVQNNADPGIYADKASDAIAVAEQAGIDLDRTAAGAQEPQAGGTVEEPANDQAAASTDLVWPVGKDAPQTSPYGWRDHPVSGGKKFHSGQDFGIPSGTDVHAMADGEVTFSGEQSGYGYVVIIKHTIDGEVIGTAYAHLSKRTALVGQQVSAGDLIAKSGGDAGDPGAGTSTGAHLHFEVRPGNHGTGEANTTDPVQFLKTGKAADAPDGGGDGGGGGKGGKGGDDKCGTGGNDGNTPGGTPDGAPEPPKKEGGRWPDESCSEEDPTQPDKADACVTPRTAILVELAKSQNFGHDGATCWDPHEQNATSDHPKGRACDFTYGKLGEFPDDADVKRGDSLANYLKENYDEWGVDYVIWQGKIWSKSKKDQGWRDYSGGGSYDPDDATGGHYDHVHVSMQ